MKKQFIINFIIRPLRAIVHWITVKVLSFPKFIYTTKNWLPIIGYTLAISTFLNVIGFFNPKVSLDIKHQHAYKDSLGEIKNTFADVSYHDINEFRNFYEFNSYPLPNISHIITKPNILKEVFYPDENDLNDQKIPDVINLASKDVEILNLIYNSKVINNQDVSHFIENIESQLNNLQWHKVVGGWAIPNSLLDNYKTYLTKTFKQHLSKFEYYTFICAMLYSRRVENPILITNNSEITLEDIKIFIPSPESKISGGDSCNIIKIDYDFEPNIVYNTIIDQKKLTIEIPEMKPNEIISLRIITRENKINYSNFAVSYKEKPSIIKKQVWTLTIKTFVILIIIQFLLHHQFIEKLKLIEKSNKRHITNYNSSFKRVSKKDFGRK